MKSQVFVKKDFILNKCTNKSVLDLGCVEHDLYRDHLKLGSWIHENIKRVAKGLVGVDMLKDEISELNNMGYNILFGNVEDLESIKEIEDKHFDVIVAGDLIEHLFNAGLFLKSCRSKLNTDGELIITTPNCFSIKYVVPAILNNNEVVREDHTCWYSTKTLKQLLQMNGFSIKEFHYRSDIKVNGIRPFLRKKLRTIFPFLSEGLICVATPIKND